MFALKNIHCRITKNNIKSYKKVYIPTRINVDGKKVLKVSLGDQHSAAITTDGKLYMWGSNKEGQLGNGTMVMQAVPVKILDNVEK